MMDELIDQISSYPFGQRVLAVILISLVLFGGFWFMFFQPLQASIQDKKDKYSRAKSSVDLGKIENKRNRLQNKKERVIKKLALYENQFPDRAEIPRLLEIVHSTAQSVNLEIKDFKRRSEVKKDNYVEIPVQMELVGTFRQFANFLDQVAEIERIVSVRNFQIQRQAKGLVDQRSLKISATAYTYRSLNKSGG
jgi:type IV pilus assembly protein PilO